MNKQKQRSRPNISIRLQPYEGSLLAKIAQWFQTMPIEEKNHIVSHVLVMTCLPLAQADGGADQEEIERYYWEFEKWLHFYKVNLKERLKIQGQCHCQSELRTAVFESNFKNQEDDDVKVTSKKSQLMGEKKAKVKNPGSLFDGLG